MFDVEFLYRQHLSDADRELLRSVAGDVPLLQALESPALETLMFGPQGTDPASPASPAGPASPVDTTGRHSTGGSFPRAGHGGGVSVGVSPFLAFATAVHRTAAMLEKATFVEERWAPRTRIPVFDVAELRVLLSEQERRYFLVELLASYTRVASGVTWTRTARGWRRRRYSELDPARLAELLEVVEASERPGIYRRLGDVALFLLGVFPDAPPVLSNGAATDRLLRLSGVRRDRALDLGAQPLLELLGARWYRAAVSSAKAVGTPVTAPLAVVSHMADHFREARRTLNAVTDRYLFPWREQWFGAR